MTAQPHPRAHHTVVVVIPHLTVRQTQELADWLAQADRTVLLIRQPEDLAHWIAQAEATRKLQLRHTNRRCRDAS